MFELRIWPLATYVNSLSVQTEVQSFLYVHKTIKHSELLTYKTLKFNISKKLDKSCQLTLRSLHHYDIILSCSRDEDKNCWWMFKYSGSSDLGHKAGMHIWYTGEPEYAQTLKVVRSLLCTRNHQAFWTNDHQDIQIQQIDKSYRLKAASLKWTQHHLPYS